MPNCVDCGIEVVDVNIEEEVVRCYNCVYHNNLNKAAKKTIKYCLIVIGGLFIFEILFLSVVGLLNYFVF